MVRVKRGLMTKKRHKSILGATKWYRMLNSRSFSRSKNAWMKAGLNAYIWRKTKKRDFRKLWTIRINTAARENGTTYSKLVNALYKKKVSLNRKVLSNLAIENPQVFKNVVKFVKAK
jgi:large subunit ribosomal protein L20